MRHLGAVSPSSLLPRSPSSSDLQVNLAPRLRRPSYAARGLGFHSLGHRRIFSGSRCVLAFFDSLELLAANGQLRATRQFVTGTSC